MKVAVKTAVLSKRWKFLWSSVPDLDFYYSNEYENEFVNLVDRTLILYQGSKIREFRVDFDYKDWFASHVDSWIRFVVIPGYEGYHNILREALEKLHYVMDLTIGCWCIQHLGVVYSSNKCIKALKTHTIEEFCRLTWRASRHSKLGEVLVLSTWELKILPSPSSKCKCLTLDPCLNNWDLAGIANLLRSSPDLETLVVDMAFPRSPLFDSLVLNGFGGENYWKSTKPFFQCLLQNLKTVRIVGFISRRGEMDLVQFLLKHAMVLEKMMIYSKRLAHLKWRKCFKPEELLEFTQMILSFPRASPHAVILFS
ncbi:hypothetical protein HHK36_023721 [Tetracentron sinense]|uniref:FBD domain-containing protein n=1 Tax=Tetracentron sinense TaxID=13715 RepID=A0A834YTQ2_TETSI|nr:hypothetical protein HHK36_023721 [Tetracentron sinense]